MSEKSRFAEACKYPFSNGTEQHAWISRWCEFCVHDHDMTHLDATGGEGCSILLHYMVDPKDWSEAWIPEPDDDDFYLPSRMVCTRFEPCTKGRCKGDPGAEERAERVAEVTAYWQAVALEPSRG